MMPNDSVEERPNAAAVTTTNTTSLHDCLSLGQVEVGLPTATTKTISGSGSGGASSESKLNVSEAEVHRLPLLLRLLQQARPLLTKAPTIVGLDVEDDEMEDDKGDGNTNKATSEQQQHKKGGDALIEEAVARLEDRAALYSVAEGVQRVACTWAPAACTPRLSRLPPLKRQEVVHAAQAATATSGCLTKGGSTMYDTTLLQSIALDPLSTATTPSAAEAHLSKKQKRRASTSSGLSATGSDGRGGGDGVLEVNDEDDLYGRSDLSDFEDDALDGDRKDKHVVVLDDDNVDMKAASTVMQLEGGSSSKKRRKAADKRNHKSSLLFANASPDSPPHMVLKTLQELTQLVATSLQVPLESADETATTLPISIEDSILAEPARRGEATNSSGNSSGSSCGAALLDATDLGVTVVSLLHHASVLRHDHVAIALCRSAVPQAPALIARMGANCPAAVPCLLSACIDVYRHATAVTQSTPSNIAAVCVQAVRQLAHLSARESQRALSILSRSRQSPTVLMVEVQLELAMEHDAVSACCLLIEQLSTQNAVATSDEPSRTESGTAEERASAVCNERSLQMHLEENLDLLNRTLAFLGDQFKHAKLVNSGQICLALTAYTRVLTRVSMDRTVQTASESSQLPKWADVVLTAFDSMIGEATELSADSILASSRPTELLIVAVVSTMAVLLSMTTSFTSNDTNQRASDILQNTFKLSSNSFAATRNLIARLTLAFQTLDAASVHEVIEATAMPDFDPANVGSLNEILSSRLAGLCEWASSSDLLDGSDVELGESMFNPSLALQFFQCPSLPDTRKAGAAKRLLNTILKDKAIAAQFVRFNSAPSAVLPCFTAACAILSSEPIPLVLPLDMEACAVSVMDGKDVELEPPYYGESVFLLRLLYSFLYLKSTSALSFRLDPRVLPLRQIYRLCSEERQFDSMDGDVMRRLKSLIEENCPEVVSAHQYTQVKAWRKAKGQHTSTAVTRSEFLKFMMKCIAEPNFDPCGLKAERAFVIARECLSDAHLFAASASALVSQPLSPPLFLTYPMLYRDPLVVLKSPLNVWRRNGTRRVALRVLTHLLDVNDSAAATEIQNNEVVEEYLSSRNELVVRSLLGIMYSSTDLDKYSRHCGLTTGILRKIVARHRGLVATLIKQGVPESQLDWMIDSIPELIEDASALRSCLSERCSLTVAQRLVAADGILRIAVCQGYRHDNGADALVSVAMAQLLSSFFLIIGPVGVPVIALVGEGTGLDATQISRKAAFRMLKALEKLRSHRTSLKAEVLVSLQKFAGMCKGEFIVGAPPSAIASRQKALMKDLLESTGKVLDSLGSDRELKA